MSDKNINVEENQSQQDFAANLLASMEKEPADSKESFEERHPRLSSMKRKLKKVFRRTDDGEEVEEEVEVEEEEEEEEEEDNVNKETEHKSTSPTNQQAANETSTEPKKRRNRRKEKIQQREAERVKLIQEASEEAKTEEDKRVVELKGMGMMITKAGLVEHEVQPDGHCLFHSLSDQLEVRKGIKTDAQELRKTLAEFIRAHPDDFVPYLLDEETGELRDINEYTKELETTPLWGGDLEIQAASRVYETPIKVHFASQMPLVVNEELYKETESLHLAYYQAKFGLGAHYNSLRDAEVEKKEEK